MVITFVTFHSAAEPIVNGARLLAVAQDLDPDTLASIVRKSARCARQAMLIVARSTTANDKE